MLVVYLYTEHLKRLASCLPPKKKPPRRARPDEDVRRRRRRRREGGLTTTSLNFPLFLGKFWGGEGGAAGRWPEEAPATEKVDESQFCGFLLYCAHSNIQKKTRLEDDD